MQNKETEHLAGKFVLLTTDHTRRGVFAGKLIEHSGTTARLSDAHMVIYWSSSVRGLLGLAANGPDDKCRITAAVPEIYLEGVDCIMAISEKAFPRWDKVPWK